MTSLRRGLEGRIQNNPKDTSLTKDVNNHSNQVVPIYDNMSASRRNLFMHSLGSDERTTSDSQSAQEDFERVYNKSRDQEKDDILNLKKGAQAYLDKKKEEKGKVTNLTPVPLDVSDTEFLCSIFTKEDIKG